MKTLIIKNPAVADYFDNYEGSAFAPGDPGNHADTERSRSIRTGYEDGKIIVFHDAKLKCDLDFLRMVSIRSTRNDNYVKKAKGKDLLVPIYLHPKTGFTTHVLSHFFDDPVKAAYYQQQIIKINEQFQAFVSWVFPKYKFTDLNYSWRFTPTLGEDMHYDSYGLAPDHTNNVRVFANVDSRPRFWAVSHRMPETMRIYRDRLRALSAEQKALDPNLFADVLNKMLPWDEMPRHYISIMPGTVMLTNTQLIAHEAIWGRRLLAYTYRADPVTMDDPSKEFSATIKRALKEIG